MSTETIEKTYIKMKTVKTKLTHIKTQYGDVDKKHTGKLKILKLMVDGLVAQLETLSDEDRQAEWTPIRDWCKTLGIETGGAPTLTTGESEAIYEYVDAQLEPFTDEQIIIIARFNRAANKPNITNATKARKHIRTKWFNNLARAYNAKPRLWNIGDDNIKATPKKAKKTPKTPIKEGA